MVKIKEETITKTMVEATLSLEEAVFIYTVCEHIYGDPISSYRRLADSLRREFKIIYNNDFYLESKKLHDEIDRDIKGSIGF